MPFVGSVDSENVEFRNRLIDNAIVVISRNPFFGSFDTLSTDEMEELRAGGIIDVVNSYIAIALSGGLVTLTFFVSFFVCVVMQLILAGRRSLLSSDQLNVWRVLVANILGIMFIIVTVSSITFIPILYWMVGGFGVACNLKFVSW